MQFISYKARIDGFAEVSLDIGDGRMTTVTIQLPHTPLTREDFERLVDEQVKLVMELKSRIGYLDSLTPYQTLYFGEEGTNATS